MQPASEPRRERRFVVQIVAQVEVLAVDRPEACELALVEVARRCEHGRELNVRIEELRP